jgi:hypothetical protein
LYDEKENVGENTPCITALPIWGTCMLRVLLTLSKTCMDLAAIKLINKII